MGLAVAGIVYLKDHRLDAPIANAGKLTKKKSRANEPPEAADLRPATSRQSPTTFTISCRNSKWWCRRRTRKCGPTSNPLPETRRGTYVLQAGSYKNFADADRVRAKLALQGIESNVQKVSVDNDTWHRIRIGPISKLDELNRLRQILRKADVDVLVIRVGD